MLNKYRSKFEARFAEKLKELKLKAIYENNKITFIQPQKRRSYIPDWTIGKNTYIETKGRFTSADRQKILWVREQNPETTVYMLFQDSKKTLSKVSHTTYGDWCDKHGIPWADIKDETKWRKWFK